MSAYRRNTGDGQGLFRGRRFNRGLAWGLMIIGALIAFEIFNFSTTQFALQDILGDLTFAGMRWATILAIAFCGIDFAGIARIFTPEQGAANEPKEVWYLFGAWFLAATFNAILTWWGVSVAIVNHTSASGGAVISGETMTKIVPIFVAAMILLVRVMIIGTFSMSGDRLFTTKETHAYNNNPRSVDQPTYRPSPPQPQPAIRSASSLNRPANTPNNTFRPAPKPNNQQTSFARPEPTYHNLSYNGQNTDRSGSERSYDA